MGGPCRIMLPTTSSTYTKELAAPWGQRALRSTGHTLWKAGGNRHTKMTGPAATDNFQVRPFHYNNLEYLSVEQAYQALKSVSCDIDPRSCSRHEKIRLLFPRLGENDSSHGMRCWSLGQVGPTRPDWNHVKVDLMYKLNRAKYYDPRNISLKQDLLATGSAEMTGGPSTIWKHYGRVHKWSFWNGIIQMRIREELRADRTPTPLKESSSTAYNPVRHERLIKMFDAYNTAA